MKRSSNRGRASLLAALTLLILLGIVVGMVALWQGRVIDNAKVGETTEKVAVDLGQAAKRLRDESLDALTTTKVKTALVLSRSVAAFDIDVDTEDGLVTLSGRLPSKESKDTALKIARDVDGVDEVADRLEVVADAEPTLGTEEIAGQIADLKVESGVYEALLRATDVDASDIRVTVDGGEVVLEGSVPREVDVERSRAITASVPGVRTVSSRLVVKEPFASSLTPPSERQRLALTRGL